MKLPALEFLYREDLGPDDRAAVFAVLQPCLGLLAPPGVVPSSRYFIETIALSRLGPGAAIPRHADNAAPDETGEWVPNGFRQRHLSAVLDLDGEHEGGANSTSIGSRSPCILPWVVLWSSRAMPAILTRFVPSGADGAMRCLFASRGAAGMPCLPRPCRSLEGGVKPRVSPPRLTGAQPRAA